jgi:hypothetical protein
MQTVASGVAVLRKVVENFFIRAVSGKRADKKAVLLQTKKALAIGMM